jgi:RimJ/RimL family protein N-acetyltransferase
MHFTQSNQAEMLAAASAATESLGWSKDARAFGAIRDDGALVAVAVFENFTGKTADLHFAMLNGSKMGAETVSAIVQIAFHPRALDLDRLWTVTSEDNRAAQVAALKVGFQFEYRKRAGLWHGKDAIVFSMGRAGAPLAAAKHQEQTEKSEV